MSAERMAVGGKLGRSSSSAEPARFRLNAGTQPFDRVCTVIAVVGIALLTLRRWILLGSYPPGLDGAQWLALGRGLHGFGRSTEGAYAPLVPLLAATADALSGPLLAMRLIAALSGLAVSLAVWLVTRDALGPVWGLVVAAFVLPASAVAEPLLYGGYPQLFALASGIVALWASCRFLAHSDHRSLWLAGTFALLTASAHHVYFAVVALSIATACVLWQSHHAALARLPRIRSLALVLVPSLVTFGAVAFAFVSTGYTAPLDASARSSFDAWEYTTREAPVLWLLMLVFGTVSLAVSWRARAHPAWLIATSLIIPAGVLVLLFGQPRLLPPVMVGAAIAAGLGARRLPAAATQVRAATVIVAAAMAAALLVPADRAVSSFAGFYEVVDQSLVDAAAAIEHDGAPGAVAVRQDRRGWPIGWWFEALLERPVLVGSDLRWLAFPEESANARQANALFDGGLDAGTFQKLAASAGVRYLVIPKWEWIGWERWIQAPGFPVSVVHDDDRYLVLRVN